MILIINDLISMDFLRRKTSIVMIWMNHFRNCIRLNKFLVIWCFKMKFNIILFLNVLCIKCSILKYEISEMAETNETVSIPIEIISNYLLKYLNDENVFLSISAASSNGDQKYVQEILLTNLLKNSMLSNFSYDILSNINRTRQGNRNAFNLIFVDGSDSLKNIFKSNLMQTFHLNERFLIVMTKSVQNDVSNSLNELFGIVLNFGLLSVNILIKDEHSMTWSLYFYKPYIRNCRSFDILRINSFSSQNYTNEMKSFSTDLYAPKYFTFPNCPLLISTFPFEPYVIIQNASNEQIKYDGIDIIIVNKISKILNLTPEYVKAPDRGEIFENGTTTGAIKMVN